MSYTGREVVLDVVVVEQAGSALVQHRLEAEPGGAGGGRFRDAARPGALEQEADAARLLAGGNADGGVEAGVEVDGGACRVVAPLPGETRRQPLHAGPVPPAPAP